MRMADQCWGRPKLKYSNSHEAPGISLSVCDYPSNQSHQAIVSAGLLLGGIIEDLLLIKSELYKWKESRMSPILRRV